MAQRQQVHADVHNADDIAVVNDNLIEVDSAEDDTSSQDSGDVPDQQGNQTLATDAQIDIQDQWRFLKQRERELAAERKLFEQQKEDEKRQAKIIQAINMRTADRRAGDTKRSSATTDYDSRISSIRPVSDSFDDRVQRTIDDVHNKRPQVAEVQLQPQQQHQVTTMSKEVATNEIQLRTMRRQIRMLEEWQSQQFTDDRQRDIEATQEDFLRLTKETEELKAKLAKTKDTAEKFKSFVKMPVTNELLPLGVRFNHPALDAKNIHKTIRNTFDPTRPNNNELEHFWIQILRYGSAHHLNEEEHLHVLGECVRGPALETYESCRERGYDLRKTLNELAVLYGTTTTINDYKRQLDEFTRSANEPIRKCMARYDAILMKTKHGVPDQTWAHTMQLKQMLALKQFIHENTRAYIQLEEMRNQVEGSAMLPIEHWITRVEEYESVHNQIPKKEMKSIVMTATMAPAFSQDQIDQTTKQLHHFKVNHAHNQEMSGKVTRLEQALYEMQVASAEPKFRYKDQAKRSGPYDPQKSGHKIRGPEIAAGIQRADNRMETDEFIPNIMYRADQQGALPPPLMPTKAPTFVKPADRVGQQHGQQHQQGQQQHQQQGQKQWPKKD